MRKIAKFVVFMLATCAELDVTSFVTHHICNASVTCAPLDFCNLAQVADTSVRLCQFLLHFIIFPWIICQQKKKKKNPRNKHTFKQSLLQVWISSLPSSIIWVGKPTVQENAATASSEWANEAVQKAINAEGILAPRVAWYRFGQ